MNQGGSRQAAKGLLCIEKSLGLQREYCEQLGKQPAAAGAGNCRPSSLGSRNASPQLGSTQPAATTHAVVLAPRYSEKRMTRAHRRKFSPSHSEDSGRTKTLRNVDGNRGNQIPDVLPGFECGE